MLDFGETGEPDENGRLDVVNVCNFDRLLFMPAPEESAEHGTDHNAT